VNRTVEKLQRAYLVRLVGTAVCVGVSIIALRLIWLGKTGDNLLPALGIAIVCGIVGWKGTVDLCGRWKQLKQLGVLQEHGPYDTREYVPPIDAARQVGDNGPNMWGS
jgi:hypothetical protein